MNSMRLPAVFVHLLLFNSDMRAASRAVEALLNQEGYRLGENLVVLISDNGSQQDPIPQLKSIFDSRVLFERHTANLGFCAGHNFGVQRFLGSGCSYFLTLNPDVALEGSALANLVEALEEDPACGMACPRLLRADQNLEALLPHRLDSCGMFMTPALRHFDRGADMLAEGAFCEDDYVFGGTGAALMLRRKAIQDLLLQGEYEADVDRIYPQLAAGRSERAMLFDEAFFAYREDAELAWRAQYMGWKCRYVAAACGNHIRVVTPDRRAKIAPEINRMGVRNRFLLQLNLYWPGNLHSLVRGILWRNAVVVAGVVLGEWSSLGAFREVWVLRRRARARRRMLFARSRVSPQAVAKWFFRAAPYGEALVTESVAS